MQTGGAPRQAARVVRARLKAGATRPVEINNG